MTSKALLGKLSEIINICNQNRNDAELAAIKRLACDIEHGLTQGGAVTVTNPSPDARGMTPKEAALVADLIWTSKEHRTDLMAVFGRLTSDPRVIAYWAEGA